MIAVNKKTGKKYSIVRMEYYRPKTKNEFRLQFVELKGLGIYAGPVFRKYFDIEDEKK